MWQAEHAQKRRLWWMQMQRSVEARNQAPAARKTSASVVMRSTHLQCVWMGTGLRQGVSQNLATQCHQENMRSIWTFVKARRRQACARFSATLDSQSLGS